MEFWKYYRILKRRIGLFSGVAVIVFTVVAIARSVQGGGVSYNAVLRIFTTPPGGVLSKHVQETDMRSNLGTLLTLASSQPVLQNVIRKLDLKLTVPEIERKVGIGQEGGTGILRISVNTNDARESKVVAQTLGEEFLAYIDELNKQETKTARTFLEERLDQARKELLDAKKSLHEFQTGTMPVAVAAASSGGLSVNVAPALSSVPDARGGLPPGLVSLGDDPDIKLTKQVSKRISETMQQKQSLLQSLQSTKAELAELGAKLAKTPKTVVTHERIVVSPAVQSLRQRRDELKVELAQLQVTKTSDHPEVRLKQKYLDQVERKLQEEESREGMVKTETVQGPNPAYQTLADQVARLQAAQQAFMAQLNATDKVLKEYEAFLPRAPLEEIKYNALLLEATVREQTYLSLAREVDSIRVQEKVQNKLGNLTLMGPPVVYGGPLQSVIKNLTLALMMALGAGLGMVIALDYLDNRVKTPQDVETLLQLPILGIIPASETYPASWRRDQQGWSARVLEVRDRVARMLPGGREDRR